MTNASARPAGPVGELRIILLGARGSGKTTVGRAVAARLGWPLIDTDERIQTVAKRTIRNIFERDGEAAFRKLEAAALRKACSAAPPCVISVGGGAVVSDENRAVLRAAGRCVWLTAAPEALQRRTAADPRSAAQRPALGALGPGGPLEEFRRLLAERAPWYKELAELTIDTSNLPADAVAERIVRGLGLDASGRGA